MAAAAAATAVTAGSAACEDAELSLQEILHYSPFITVAPLSFGHETQEEHICQQRILQNLSCPSEASVRSASSPSAAFSSTIQCPKKGNASGNTAAFEATWAPRGGRVALFASTSTLPSVLLLWSTLPLIISIISELLVSHSGVAHVRSYNIIDMCFATPAYIAIAVLLMRTLDVSLHHVPLAWSCWCVFIFGRGIHTAADAAHSLVTEISPSLAALTPPALLSCLHMLDEHVGHVVLWSGYFAFWIVLLRGSRRACKFEARACAAAVVMGATHAVALIESSHPELGLFALVIASVAFRAKNSPFLLRCFTIIFAASLIAAMAAYRIILGSFKQPSEMGGIFATARLAISIVVAAIGSSAAHFACAQFGVCCASAVGQEL